MSIMILTKWLRSSASFAMPSKFSSAQVKQSHKPLGDTISWQIAPVGNVVFLKPRERAGC
jgi:type IV secretory pathway VirB9-like protein